MPGQEQAKLLGPSKTRLIEELAGGEKSAAELAHALGINETAVRGHLDAMGRMGFVTADFYHEGVGRPKKRYMLSAAGKELQPRNYGMLLRLLLTKITEKQGTAYTAGLLNELAAEMAATVPRGKDDTLRERAKSLEIFLNDLGFQASLVEKDGKLELIRQNCIFLSAAEDSHGLVCHSFDNELLKRTLGSDKVELTQCMADGAKSCHNVVRLRDAEAR